jgi:hypothetical protein
MSQHHGRLITVRPDAARIAVALDHVTDEGGLLVSTTLDTFPRECADQAEAFAAHVAARVPSLPGERPGVAVLVICS